MQHIAGSLIEGNSKIQLAFQELEEILSEKSMIKLPQTVSMKRMICSLLLRWWRGIRNVEPAPLHPPDVCHCCILEMKCKMPRGFSWKKKCRVHSQDFIVLFAMKLIRTHASQPKCINTSQPKCINKSQIPHNLIFALILWMSIMIHLTSIISIWKPLLPLMSSRHKKTWESRSHKIHYILSIICIQK